jgi:hypothetical protein
MKASRVEKTIKKLARRKLQKFKEEALSKAAYLG